MEDELIRLPHPDGDDTWVEFHGMSKRQMEVLLAYAGLYEQATEGSGMSITELLKEEEDL